MKKSILLLIALVLLTGSGLKAQTPTPTPTPVPAPVVLLKSEQYPPGNWRHYLEVTTPAPLNAADHLGLRCSGAPDTPCNPTGPVIGALFKEGTYQPPGGDFRGIPLNRPVVFDRCPAAPGPEKTACEWLRDDRRTFRIYLPNNLLIPAEIGKYSVVFYNYPTGGPPADPWQASAKMPVERFPGTIYSGCSQDDDVFGVMFRTSPTMPAALLTDIANWFNNVLSLNPDSLVVKTNAKSEGHVVENTVKKVISAQYPVPGSDRIIVCLQMDKGLPNETYNAVLDYRGVPGSAPPAELLLPPRVDKIEVSPLEEVESALADTKAVEERKLEKNLDVVFSFTSERVTKTTPVTHVERDTRGVLDLRFVPKIFEKYKVFLEDDKAHYLTWKPFYIDAKVATGKIEESTISLNRIALGTDFEYRYYADPRQAGTYYRYNFRGVNASDRDFKLVEGKFNFEFRPVIDFLNKTIDTDGKIVDDPLSDDPSKRKYIPGGWGFSLVPSFGVEFGKTYRNHRPAAGLIEKPKFFRGVFGLEFTFNPVPWITYSIEDKFYSRTGWEKGRRGINYFKTSLDIALFKRFRVPQSIFISYENGKQPPFTNEVVNSIKAGYRIRTNW